MPDASWEPDLVAQCLSMTHYVADAPRLTDQRPTIGVAGPDFDINHVIAYGQSLSSGWEGWPALSLLPRHDSLMLGGSVRPRDEAAARWRPVGAAEFRPLTATVQAQSGRLLTPEEVATLARGDVAMGETVLEAAVNTWRGRMLAAPRRAGTHRLLASSCGVGGRSLEALSRGAKPELFNRLRDCAIAAKQAAAAHGLGYGVTALLFLQGENNSWGIKGATDDRATYKTLLKRFYEDFIADVAIAIAGQPAPPAMFIYQTGGAYSTDSVSVAQAQLESALELPGCYLVAPVYPLSDRPSGHLDAHGYHWLGAQFGKVMHRVLTLGEDWKPLHPLGAAIRDKSVVVTFHVPVPPLCWGRPFAGQVMIDIPDRGFTVIDGAGVVPITAVELAGPSQVRITLARALRGAVELRYADRRHRGRGSLHDSDADKSAHGRASASRMLDLADWTSRLMNWCVAFTIPVGPPDSTG